VNRTNIQLYTLKYDETNTLIQQLGNLNANVMLIWFKYSRHYILQDSPTEYY